MHGKGTCFLFSSLEENPATMDDNKYELNLDVFANADITGRLLL